MQRRVRARAGQAVRRGRELLLALLQLHTVRGAGPSRDEDCFN